MASDVMGAYFPQPMAKKSPTGTSTEGSVSSSQYIRKMEKGQVPVGVIQKWCTEPGQLISPRVSFFPGSITIKGFTFHPRPRSRAALEATPSAAVPPFPFSPLKFSGLMENDFASDVRNMLLSPLARPSYAPGCAERGESKKPNTIQQSGFVMHDS